MPVTFGADFACLQRSPFETVILYNFWSIHPNSIGKHAQVKHFPNGSANHARLTTIKRLNLPIKSQAFQTGRLSCVGVALNFNSLGRIVLQHNPPVGLLQKRVRVRNSSAKYQYPTCVWHCTMKAYVL